MKTVALALFAILLLSHITAADKIQHQCVHDEKFKGYKRQLVEEHTDESWRRIMQGIPTSGSGSVSGGFSTGGSANVADGWHQLRISMDYRQSNTFVQSSSSLSSVYQLSIRQIETVRTYFMKFFQVNFSANLRFGGGTCYKNNIPAFDIPADLFITVFAENNRATSYFAAATTCASTTRDGRPVIGAYILNLAFLKATPINEYLYFSTFAHEFTHILGFSDDLFPDFVVPGTNKKRGLNAVMGTTNIGGNTFATIVLPEVVNYAKSYFGCPSITGIPLENNGGSGSASSHWEKTFLPQEYMNPTVENPGIISDFTLNLLRGSGWYKIDTAAVQHYDWAQNSGCGHFSICPVGPGYCKGSQVSVDICSSEYNAKAYCDESRTFGSACPVKRSESHSCLLASYTPVLQNEYYGPGSRCINYVSAAGPEASKCHRVNVRFVSP